jgi:hypothetical protein
MITSIEGDVGISNLLGLVSVLFSNDIVHLIATRACQQSFRLISVSAHRLADLDTPHPQFVVDIAEICWNVDAQLIQHPTSRDFRGFAQLLIQILKTKNFGKMVIDLVVSKLANRKSDLISFVQRRGFLAAAICDHATIESFPRDNDSVAVILFLYAGHSGKNKEQLKSFLKSYPEIFVHGFVVLLGVIGNAQGWIMYSSILRELSNLYMDTFVDCFFLNDHHTIVSLFPESLRLHQTVVTLALQMAMMLVQDHNAESERAVATDLKRIICFGGHLYLTIPKASRKNALKLDNIKSESLSILLGILSRLFSSVRGNELAVEASRATILLVDLARVYNLKINHVAIRLLNIMLTTVLLSPIERSAINDSIDEYEKKTKHLLPRPPADIRRTDVGAASSFRKGVIDLDLEGKVLADLQSAQEKQRERLLPVALCSNAIPIIPRPTSRVDNIKAELYREQAAAPTVRKRALPRPTKPQRLDEGRSSASDSEDTEDYGALKQRFSKTRAEDHSANRSVKLIDITDNSDRKGPAKADHSSMKSEVNRISQFHRTILHFDLRNESLESAEAAPSPVPSSFTSAAHYISVFEPLLYLECRAQLAQSREETANEETQTMRIVGVAHVDDFHEVILQWDENETRGRISDQDYLMFLFSEKRDSLPAVVVQTGSRNGNFEATLRLSIPTEKSLLQLELREGLRVGFRKIGNVITNLREFMALNTVGMLSLATAIFEPRFIPVQAKSLDPEMAGLCRALHINVSQAKAISAVMQNVNPITLIQGPPGTGKTKTIEALLSVLLCRISSRGKVLICAPSNAAIDEIVRRIRHGLVTGTGTRIMPKILRVGSLDMISDQVKDLTLDSQVDALLASGAAASTQLLDSQRKLCEDLRRSLTEAERKNEDPQVKSLKTALWEARENMRKNTKFIEETRSTLKQNILNEAQIVCCTLSSSGHEILVRVDFEYVIIDEACQAVELSCLVPLQHNCRQLVLVGGLQCLSGF